MTGWGIGAGGIGAPGVEVWIVRVEGLGWIRGEGASKSVADATGCCFVLGIVVVVVVVVVGWCDAWIPSSYSSIIITFLEGGFRFYASVRLLRLQWCVITRNVATFHMSSYNGHLIDYECT